MKLALTGVEPVSDQMLEATVRIEWDDKGVSTSTQLEVLAEFVRRARVMLTAIDHEIDQRRSAPLVDMQGPKATQGPSDETERHCKTFGGS